MKTAGTHGASGSGIKLPIDRTAVAACPEQNCRSSGRVAAFRRHALKLRLESSKPTAIDVGVVK
jgi:hypothetical protein